jgi:hypothetical protein
MSISNRIGNQHPSIGNLIMQGHGARQPRPDQYLPSVRNQPTSGQQRSEWTNPHAPCWRFGRKSPRPRSGYRSIGNHETIGNRPTSKVTEVTAVTDTRRSTHGRPVEVDQSSVSAKAEPWSPVEASGKTVRRQTACGTRSRPARHTRTSPQPEGRGSSPSARSRRSE